MTKFDNDNERVDPFLADLSEKIEPINDEIVKNPELAILCIGVKNIGDDGVQTYTNVKGSSGVLAEGLYHELTDQIEKGDLSLFTLLADVVHEIEEDLSDPPDMEDEEQEPKDEGRDVTFH